MTPKRLLVLYVHIYVETDGRILQSDTILNLIACNNLIVVTNACRYMGYVVARLSRKKSRKPGNDASMECVS